MRSRSLSWQLYWKLIGRAAMLSMQPCHALLPCRGCALLQTGASLDRPCT